MTLTTHPPHRRRYRRRRPRCQRAYSGFSLEATNTGHDAQLLVAAPEDELPRAKAQPARQEALVQCRGSLVGDNLAQCVTSQIWRDAYLQHHTHAQCVYAALLRWARRHLLPAIKRAAVRHRAVGEGGLRRRTEGSRGWTRGAGQGVGKGWSRGGEGVVNVAHVCGMGAACVAAPGSGCDTCNGNVTAM